MALLWGDTRADRQVLLLRRRVELLEEQVRLLARFTGIDPHHLPQEREVLGEEAARLALAGHKVAAVRAHRKAEHVDLKTAVVDVETFLAQHERV
ncbi:hypothetical protein [Arsenicicoccus dermatophilus]|uniref:hypothetical protein n=1 Tax=Arsenicicoccus dermatophilus TaxID=1076331 RepID=UPI001F4C8B10|nr:hypothetical protein [Arsenicicoccus dermatophilus]MCH8613549.1 hypothetical protein [Arsenicicoccus dermatophilus]